MKKLLFASILICLNVFAVDLSERRAAILQIIDQEMRELGQLSAQVQSNNPNLLLRLAELNLEKARLWREQENEKFLEVDASKRANLNKSNFFKESNRYFDDARRVCLLLLKKFPNYGRKNEIYYILAFDAKERNNNKDAVKYFQLANKNSKATTAIQARAQVGLAEIYYNQKKYKEAIPLYEKSLRLNDDKWWTKDALNLAWCYYRQQNYSSAINLMQNVYAKSKQGKYIDMTSMVLRDIGLFYADARRMEEGLQFYQKAGLNATAQLIKVGNYLVSKGNITSALSVFVAAKNYEKETRLQADIMLNELEAYDKFGKVNLHYAVAKELSLMAQKNILNSDERERLIYHVDKMAAVLQKKISGNLYKNVESTRNQLGQFAINYFELSIILNKVKVHEKVFLKGETSYAMERFEQALDFYLAAHDEAIKVNDKVVAKNTLESMLASLGEKKLNQKEKYYLPVYSRYLAFDNKSDRAKSIFEKLFNVHMEKKDVAQAEQVLIRYTQSFPDDFKIQEAMLAKIMEQYRVTKNNTQIKRLINDINSKKYLISKKYAASLKKLLTNIQMEDVQQMLKRGDKAGALKGYYAILASPESTDRARKNSAYNLAILYYELGDIENSYKWTSKALDMMSGEEVIKFEDSFITISSFLFERLQFQASSDVSITTLKKECKLGSKNKDLMFKNAVFIQIAERKHDKVEEYLNLTSSCGISPKVELTSRLELAKSYLDQKNFRALDTHLAVLRKDEQMRLRTIDLSEKLRIEHLKVGNSNKAQEIKSLNLNAYNQALKQKLKIPVESLDVIAQYLVEDLLQQERRYREVVVSFPENVFNQKLKLKFQLLDQVSAVAQKINQTASGSGIVESYSVLIRSYQEIIQQIKSVDLSGKSEDYKKSFWDSMSKVINPLSEKQNSLRSELARQIKTHSILSDSNLDVINPVLTQKIYPRFDVPATAVMMDRAGRN
jgi:tetratricopeptide (TPR) repeat protein